MGACAPACSSIGCGTSRCGASSRGCPCATAAAPSAAALASACGAAGACAPACSSVSCGTSRCGASRRGCPGCAAAAPGAGSLAEGARMGGGRLRPACAHRSPVTLRAARRAARSLQSGPCRGSPRRPACARRPRHTSEWHGEQLEPCRALCTICQPVCSTGPPAPPPHPTFSATRRGTWSWQGVRWLPLNLSVHLDMQVRSWTAWAQARLHMCCALLPTSPAQTATEERI